MTRRSVTLVLLALFAAAGCTAKKPASGAAKGAAEGAGGGGAGGTARAPKLVPHPMTGPRQPGVVSRLAPIAADEVRALLPAPEGMRVLARVDHAAIGQRVEGSFCADAGTIAELGAQLTRQYVAAGWPDFAVHVNPTLADRATVTASKPPYVLFGQLTRASREDCRGSGGKTVVILGVHHVEAVVPYGAAPAAAGAQGTTGLRGP
jgi:hypothetical protein